MIPLRQGFYPGSGAGDADAKLAGASGALDALEYQSDSLAHTDAHGAERVSAIGSR